MKDFLLAISRILLIAGIIAIAGSVFWDNYHMVIVSTSKAKLEDFDRMIEDKLDLNKPIEPVDLSNYLVPPKTPDNNATEQEWNNYKNNRNNYNDEVEKAKAEYRKDYKKYLEDMKNYEYDLLRARYQKKKSEIRYKLIKRKYIENINRYKNYDNFNLIPFYIRYGGVGLLLLGALGILIMAEVYEKLGILVLIGFAFKYITGL